MDIAGCPQVPGGGRPKLKGRKLRLNVTCAVATCPAATWKLGKRALRIPAGGTRTVTVKLSKKAAKALRRKPKVSLTGPGFRARKVRVRVAS